MRTVSGLSTEVIVAAVLGFAVTTSFWLAYFDFFTIRAHQLLTDRSGVERAALARDVYTYLHFPMVAGIVLFAFAMKTTLADVDGELATIPALGLCGGPALYLFAFVALRVRVSRTLRGGRLIAAIALRLAVAGGRRRAGARRAHAGGDRLGRDFTRTKSSGGAKPAHKRARSECPPHENELPRRSSLRRPTEPP